MALGWRGQYFRYREYFLNVLDLYKRRADLRAFIEIILSLSTVTIFLVFALKPTALTIVGLVQEINEKRATLVTLNQKINDLTSAQAVYAQNKDLIQGVDTAIPTKPEPDVISKQVIGLAAKDSVNILGLSIGQVTLMGKEASVKRASEFKPLPGGVREMPISINVQGDYPALLSFISDFENLKIASKIDLVGVSASSTGGQSVIVTLISARIPYLGG
jgi:hypothetical protein